MTRPADPGFEWVLGPSRFHKGRLGWRLVKKHATT
jgi:hypothetical protein